MGRVIRLPVGEPLEATLATLGLLERAELEQVREQVGALLAAMAPPPVEPTRTKRLQAQRGQGWIEARFVYDRQTGRQYGPYLYRRWRDGRRKRTQYVGKPTAPVTPASSVLNASSGSDGVRDIARLEQAQAPDGPVGLPPEVPQT
jgi:hypothetical protein